MARTHRRSFSSRQMRVLLATGGLENRGVQSPQQRGPTMVHAPAFVPTPPRIAARDRLGDEIADLSAHLEAPTARRGLSHANAPRLADPAAEDPTWAQRQADALGLVAQGALHAEPDPGPAAERYQVVVHVD